MSAAETVGDRVLRLSRRDQGGYYVRVAGTGRTLGAVWRDRGKWWWATSANAYRGDGRPGSECDGHAADVVPEHLAGGGRETGRRRACAALVEHLVAHRAPVLGYGAHAAVTVREAVRA